jgi:hypothetical protein
MISQTSIMSTKHCVIKYLIYKLKFKKQEINMSSQLSRSKFRKEGRASPQLDTAISTGAKPQNTSVRDSFDTSILSKRISSKSS